MPVGFTSRKERPSRQAPSLTSVGFLLHTALSRLTDGVLAAVEGSGLHPGQLAILGALTDAGATSQRKLSELTRIEKSSMVLLLDALEAGKWVSREADPKDRRAHIVRLTRSGAAKFAALGPRLEKVQTGYLAPLTADERRILIDLLQRLSAEKMQMSESDH